jgi:hypothetical protein
MDSAADMEPDELDLIGGVEFLESQLCAAGRPVNPVIVTHISKQISSTTDASERLTKWKRRKEHLQKMLDRTMTTTIPSPSVIGTVYNGTATPANQADENSSARISGFDSERDWRGQRHSRSTGRNSIDDSPISPGSTDSSPSPVSGERGRRRKRPSKRTQWAHPKRGVRRGRDNSNSSPVDGRATELVTEAAATVPRRQKRARFPHLSDQSHHSGASRATTATRRRARAAAAA